MSWVQLEVSVDTSNDGFKVVDCCEINAKNQSTYLENAKASTNTNSSTKASTKAKANASVKENAESKGDTTLYVTFFRSAEDAENEASYIRWSNEEAVKYLNNGSMSWHMFSRLDHERINACYHSEVDADGNHYNFTLNPEGEAEYMKRNGVFCIISNEYKAAEVILDLYNMSAQIIRNYPIYHKLRNAEKPRWYNFDQIRAREFTKMLALSYHYYIQAAVTRVKERCLQLSESQDLKPMLRKRFAELYQWLDESYLIKIFSWCDMIKGVSRLVFDPDRWTASCVKRTDLFLSLLYQEFDHPNRSNEVTRLNLPSRWDNKWHNEE